MKKYRVYGTTTVSVVKEVWANSEEEAYEKAERQLDSLTEYCGNGGYDKLVGVDGYDERVSAGDVITYDDCEEIEDDPDYFECPNCNEECDLCETPDGVKYYQCTNCDRCYDENGDEFYPDGEDE